MNLDSALPAIPPLPDVVGMAVFEGINAELARRDVAVGGRFRVRCWYIDKRLMPKHLALRAAQLHGLPPNGRVNIGVCMGVHTGAVPVIWRHT